MLMMSFTDSSSSIKYSLVSFCIFHDLIGVDAISCHGYIIYSETKTTTTAKTMAAIRIRLTIH